MKKNHGMIRFMFILLLIVTCQASLSETVTHILLRPKQDTTECNLKNYI